MEHLQTVQQIFSARFLRVPDYQRGYSWERKHWDDLLEDLDLLETGSEHYTGTLVLHEVDSSRSIMDEEGRAHGVYDIVDGQQRLTTIVILLDAIRRELRQGSLLADGIKKTYVLARDLEGQFQPKLTLNRDTHSFFERNIIADQPGIDGPQIRSQQLLKDAQTYLRQYLQARREQQGGGDAWLKSLFKKITNNLKLTVYEVPRASEVGVIFEVMNNRGKPLSEMEKVKNYLLYLVSKAQGAAARKLGERINETWRTLFEGLMQSGASGAFYENQLLRAHWLTVYEHQPKSWSGNDSVKRRFNLRSKDVNSLLTDIDSYTSGLGQFSVAYCDLIAPRRAGAFLEYQDRESVRQDLQRTAEKLVRMDALATFIPVLAAVRLSHPGDANLYLSFLALCEKYAFRVYRWAERRANAGQTSLFKIGHDLYHKRMAPPDALASIASHLLFYAPADEFRRELEKPTDWYNWYGLKYFLYEYEEHLASGKAVQLPWDELARTDKKESVEHVLPQTATDAYWTTRWSAEDIKLYLHDIGNLSLTFDNSSYGNKPFPQKRGTPGTRASYANSNIFMERQLTRYADWTKEECIKRRMEIVSWALQRWDVPAPPTPAAQAPVPPDEDVEGEEGS